MDFNHLKVTMWELNGHLIISLCLSLMKKGSEGSRGLMMLMEGGSKVIKNNAIQDLISLSCISQQEPA